MRLFPTALFLLALFSLTALAQDPVGSYGVGEKIEYWNHYTDKWEEGTVLEVHPQYDQLVIRQKPDQYFPKGEEKAFVLKDVRHIGGGQNDTVRNDVVQNGNGNANVDPGPPATGNGLMTRAEIIGYLKRRMPNGPDAAQNGEEVRKQLIDEIKRRGVDFHETNPGELYTAGGYSVANNLPSAIGLNLGAPVSQNWLMGAWAMYVYGLDNKYIDLNTGKISSRDLVSKLGSLTIKADGTYLWKVEPGDPPAKWVKGSWRKATNAEMGLQGGAGIVLEKAAEGYDWIVVKFMSPNVKTDNIDVSTLKDRGSYRRIGERVR